MSYKYLFNLIAIKLHLSAVHREHSALTITFNLLEILNMLQSCSFANSTLIDNC